MAQKHTTAESKRERRPKPTSTDKARELKVRLIGLKQMETIRGGGNRIIGIVSDLE